MEIVLKAENRDLAVSATSVRESGRVPVVCYGPQKENLHLSIDHSDLLKVYRQAQKNMIVNLEIDAKKVEVLFYKLEYDYLKDRITHVDFYMIDQNSPVIAEIPLKLEGTSLAVINLSCILNPLLDTLKVKCLPKDLPSSVTVDVSTLVGFDSTIRVSDLELDEGIEILVPEHRMVCGLITPRGMKADEEEELAAEEAAAAAAAGEAGSEAEGAEKEEAKKE